MATPTTLPATFVAGNVLTAAQMNDLRGAFRVLQVVQTTKTDLFTTTSATYVDVTGLSVSITPSSTDSKVLVFVNLAAGASGVVGVGARLVRGATNLALGDASGSRIQATIGALVGTARDRMFNMCVLDSPATTSSTTYKVQVFVSAALSGTNNLYVNASGDDTNNNYITRYSSSITVMEISA